MRTFLLVMILGGPPAAFVSAQTPAQLKNWHQWRGPFANGTASATETPPVSWSPTANMKWTAELPGEGTSTPIIWNQLVYTVSAKATDRKAESPTRQDERSKTVPPDVYYQFIVSCHDRESGGLMWQQVATEEVPHEGHHLTHTYAAGSPTTDGHRLYVSFGSRGIFCYSMDGSLLWKTDLGDMRTRYGWGEAVTPVIQNDSLIINWDQEEGSFITCLDAATGEPKWKTERPGEVTSWNTPLVTEIDGRWIVVVNGTGRVRAYELSTGKEIWECGGQTVNAIPSPVRFADNVIAMSGYRGAMAASIPLNSVGDITDAALNWRFNRGTPYVPSPLLTGNRLLFTGANGNILTVLNALTGEPKQEPVRLSALNNLYASPVCAGDYIYILDRSGTCVVLANNDSLDVVAVNRLDDATDASPVIVGGDLFIRSWTKLYCIFR